MKNYLALFPRPGGDDEQTRSDLWDELFEANVIERDGFVRKMNRGKMLESFEGMMRNTGLATTAATLTTTSAMTTTATATWNVKDIVFSPYEDKSPVKFLKDFFNNARHLDEELAMSSLGRLLGAAELGGTAKEGDIWHGGK